MHRTNDVIVPSRRQFLSGTLGLLATGRAAQPQSLSATGFQIGCYTRPWDQHDYRVALDGIAEAGYKYAGLMTHGGNARVLITAEMTAEEATAIGEEVRKRGLRTLSVYGGNFPVNKGIDAGIAGLKRLIDNTAACNSPGLLLGGTSKGDLTDDYYKVVAECCDYAAARKVQLTVKPHGGTNATGAECRRLIENVGHRNFRVWYDPGNIFYYSQGKLDPVSDVPSVDGLIAGMSIKDYRPPKEVMITPGKGSVNFRDVLARAKRGGFTAGPLIVECLDRGEPAKINAEAKAAREFVESLVEKRT
jgi:sugar phosphate isomerase/epimerase